MIVCPNCQNKEITGALFCSECGTQLVPSDGPMTHAISHEPTNLLVEEQARIHVFPTPPPLTGSILSLHILDAGQILPLTGREEYTLGRAAEGQTVLPDIDLSTYRAYEKGVSRLHACIKLSGQHVTVTDLGSVNGTRLNGKKIPQNQTQTLNHGDILSLGKLKVQVLIRR